MKRLYTLLIILLAAIAVFIIVKTNKRNEEKLIPSPSKTKWLVEKYGPKLYSEHDEELIIRDFFQDKKNGYFVDIGASHYRIHSTTYYLERYLNWKGLAVDAISEYERGYMKRRKNTRFYNFFVGHKSEEEIDFYLIKNDKRKSSSNPEIAQRQKDVKKIKVPTITLNDLLENEGISRIDFLSMDIELAEPYALAGFDIKKYKPSLVCIEAHDPVRNQILNYFSKNNYELVEKYISLDSRNLYFTPKK